MAHYFLRVSILTRGKRNSVTRAAAYRAGERIRDAEAGTTHDHSHRDDIAAAEIVLPSSFDGSPELEWARDRSTLWNAVQYASHRANARLAREIFVTLPPELSSAQRVGLTRQAARELADRYGCAVDFAVHRPRAHADQRHHHAHILMSCRQVSEKGMGARTTLELSGSERRDLGIGPSKNELLWLRARWADLSNAALRAAGIEARVDHRSYRDRGIDREPKPHFPKSVTYAERSGKATAAGERIRQDYRERVQARSQGADAYARVVRRQREAARQRIKATEKTRGLVQRPAARDAINKKRREAYKERSSEINLSRREQRYANREEINRKKRESSRANRDDYNRQQRERYQRRQAAKGRVVRQIARGKTAIDSAHDWLRYKSQQMAEDQNGSLEKWRRYRSRSQDDESGPPRSERGSEAGMRRPKSKDDFSL